MNRRKRLRKGIQNTGGRAGDAARAVVDGKWSGSLPWGRPACSTSCVHVNLILQDTDGRVRAV